MNTSQVIENIRQVAARVLPKGSTLYLYGSRARGDYHEESDWDLLLLLDKPKLEHEDFDKYSYPFVLMGWDLGADIRPHAYTKEEWFNGPHALFYYQVPAAGNGKASWTINMKGADDAICMMMTVHPYEPQYDTEENYKLFKAFTKKGGKRDE